MLRRLVRVLLLVLLVVSLLRRHWLLRLPLHRKLRGCLPSLGLAVQSSLFIVLKGTRKPQQNNGNNAEHRRNNRQQNNHSYRAGILGSEHVYRFFSLYRIRQVG